VRFELGEGDAGLMQGAYSQVENWAGLSQIASCARGRG